MMVVISRNRWQALPQIGPEIKMGRLRHLRNQIKHQMPAGWINPLVLFQSAENPYIHDISVISLC